MSGKPVTILGADFSDLELRVMSWGIRWGQVTTEKFLEAGTKTIRLDSLSQIVEGRIEGETPYLTLPASPRRKKAQWKQETQRGAINYQRK